MLLHLISEALYLLPAMSIWLWVKYPKTLLVEGKRFPKPAVPRGFLLDPWPTVNVSSLLSETRHLKQLPTWDVFQNKCCFIKQTLACSRNCFIPPSPSGSSWNRSSRSWAKHNFLTVWTLGIWIAVQNVIHTCLPSKWIHLNNFSGLARVIIFQNL